ncbi:hypothetical protein EK21DRAFT_113204 [Setomelanomma holmii]|uniref:Uncharacterized protein n=1 Tax=Setomelanomma holmii TaxID=210430 RepID=A0A9P4LMQ0_9PLEO|nr:hypothetical protein EK21DRAFT_113204 [Setomelanomma holmii]
MTGMRLRDRPDGMIQAIGKPNKSLMKIDEKLGKQMIGPVLAYGLKFVDEVPVQPLDLDLADFRHLVDHFRVRHDMEWRQQHDLVGGKRIQDVRVNCKGDHKVFGWPVFEVTTLPADIILAHNKKDIVHPAPKKLGIPLAIAKYGPALAWRGRRYDGQPASSNWAFTWLTSSMFQADAAPTQAYLDKITSHGSIFVTRADGKDLHPEHVKALIAYLTNAGGEHLGSEEGVSMGEYMELLSKEDFVQAWADWKEEHAEAANVPSPYA